jgi:hypothetical protein
MRSLALLGLATVVAGSRCNLDSVYPAYQQAEVVMDPRIEGSWLIDENRWEISAQDSSYLMAVFDDEDADSEGGEARTVDTTWFGVHLARHAGLLLADLLPLNLSDDDGEYLALHQYAIIVGADSVLRYRALNDDWLKRYLAAHPKELSHLMVDGDLLLTASTSQLDAFLVRHWKDESAWVAAEARRPPASSH